MDLSKSVISDRRSHDRHPFRTEAVLTLPDGRSVLAQTLDLGKGGAGIVSDINPPIGSAMTIRMRLPARPTGNVPFQAHATVANCILAGREGGFRIGLQFGALDAAALDALKGLMP